MFPHKTDDCFRFRAASKKCTKSLAMKTYVYKSSIFNIIHVRNMCKFSTLGTFKVNIICRDAIVCD
jgi:hypothetical protein